VETGGAREPTENNNSLDKQEAIKKHLYGFCDAIKNSLSFVFSCRLNRIWDSYDLIFYLEAKIGHFFNFLEADPKGEQEGEG
jgi:hypothetical protein